MRKKAKEEIVTIYSKDGEQLFNGRLFDLPLKEKAVINMSIDYYSDPTPCYIHRGAVMMRLYDELRALAALDGAIVPLPQPQRGYVDVEDVYSIRLVIEGNDKQN